MNTGALWELADEFEARARDKHRYMPIERYVWRQAAQELGQRLGQRGGPSGA